MLPILGMDLGLTSGWAFASSRYVPAVVGGPKPVSGFIDFRRHRHHAEDHGGVYRALRQFVLDRIAVFQPRILVFEAPLEMHKGAAAARLAFGMAAVVEEAGTSAGLHVVEFHVSAIKIHATGKGNVKKDVMLAAAKALGWSITENNEVDACWLVDLAVAKQARATAVAA